MVWAVGEGRQSWRIVFDFLFINGAFVQKTSSLGYKSLLPAQS
jgi:hypothetical protein